MTKYKLFKNLAFAFRKLISVSLSVALLFYYGGIYSILPFLAVQNVRAAGEDIAISAPSTTLSPGEQTIITVQLNQAPDTVDGINHYFNYDTDVFEITAAEDLNGGASGNINDLVVGDFSLESDNPTDVDGSGNTYFTVSKAAFVFLGDTGYGTPADGTDIYEFALRVKAAPTFGATEVKVADGSGTLRTSENLDGAANNASTYGSITFTISADSTPPELESISTTAVDGTYGPGATITVTADYDEDLGVGSQAEVTLDNGETVTLTNISNDTVSGDYTVGATGSGQDSSDLTVSSIADGTGGNVVTDGTNPRVSDSSVPSANDNLGDNESIVIDTTAPTVSTATGSVGSNTITLSYDETLDSGSVPVAGDYAIDASSTYAGSITGVGVSGLDVTLTLDTNVMNGETVLVDYTPGSNPIRDDSTSDGSTITAGSTNDAASLTDQIISISDADVPALVSISTSAADGTYGPSSTINITATYDEPLGAASEAVVTFDNGESVTLSTVSTNTVSGDYTVGATGSGQDTSDLTVTAIQDGTNTNPVTDGTNDRSSDSSLPAANDNVGDDESIIIDTTAPGLNTASGAVGSTTITLTYNENLDTTSTPANGDFTINGVTGGASVTGVVVGATTVTLTLDIAPSGGDNVTLDYTAGVNPIQDDSTSDGSTLTANSTNDAANLSTQAVATTDAVPPELQSFSSSTADNTYGPGSTITIQANYDEPIQDASTLQVTLDNGVVVTLDQESSNVLSGTYNVGATASGEDSADLAVASFTSESVQDTSGNTQTSSANTIGIINTANNNISDTSAIVVDVTSPVLQTAAGSVGSTTLTLTYDENLNASSTPATTDYTVNGVTGGATVTNVVVSGTGVTLTLSNAPSGGDTVTLDYTAAANPVEDTAQTAQNAAANLTAQAVTLTDSVAPVLQSFTSTTGDGTYTTGQNINITATYDEPLDAGSNITVVLDTGDSILLNSVSSNEITGSYTVGAGDTSTDLTVSSISAQNVQDPSGNTLNTTTLPGTNIADGSAIVVDGIALVVEFKDASAANAEAIGGNLPELTVRGGNTTGLAARSIEVTTTGGTATAGTDYTFTSPTTINIPAGDYSTATDISVTGIVITDDELLEQDETIIFGLQNASTGLSIGDADGSTTTETAHTYTIQNDETASIEFIAATSSTGGDEDAPPTIQVQLTLTSTTGTAAIATGETLTVDTTYNGSSTATNGSGEDIEFTSPQTFTFTDADANGATQNLTFTLTDDSDVEGDETSIFDLAYAGVGTLNSATGVSVGTNSQHTLTLNDDDGVNIEFDSATYSVTEGSANATINLLVSGASLASAESVNITTIANTAEGADFTDPGASVAIPARDYTQVSNQTVSYTIPIADDALIEPQETIDLTLTGVSDAGIMALGTQTSAILTITDEDSAQVNFSAISSNTGGDEDANQTINAVLTLLSADGTPAIAAGETLTVEVSYNGSSTATNGGGQDIDFTSPQAFSFTDADANGATESLTYTLTDDTLVESDETAIFDLAYAGVGTLNSVATAPTTAQHTFTINDDDSLIVEFDTNSSSGDESTATPTINLYVSGGEITSALSVEIYDDGSGTATVGAGNDYLFPAAATITIPIADYTAGSTVDATTDLSTQFSVNNDTKVETSQTIVLGLQNPSAGLTIGNADGAGGTEDAHTYTLSDDGDSVTVEFDSASASSTNEATADNFPQILVNGEVETGATASVDVETTGGTATGSGTDFTFSTATITINPGTYDGLVGTAQSITAPSLVNDDIVEGNETITFGFNSLNSAVAGNANGDGSTDTAHTYTITDDDTVGVIVSSIVDNITTEAGTTGSFKLELTSEPTADVTVNFTSSDTSEGTVPASFVITIANWDQPDNNEIFVTGAEDFVDDGDIAYYIDIANITSGDANYNALDYTGEDASGLTDPDFTNQDDESPGITITVVGADTTTTENNGSDTAIIQFEAQSIPSDDITIPLSIDDASEGAITATTGGNPGVLTEIVITSLNWNVPGNNQVTVTGVDDLLVDGAIGYNLITGDPSSTDGSYDGLIAADVADIALTNNDDDALTVQFENSIDSGAEGTANPTFNIQVSGADTTGGSAETIDVDVTGGTATGSGTDYTFTDPTTINIPAADYTTPQTISVGLVLVDDGDFEGDETITLQLTNNSAGVGIGAQATNTFTITDDDNAQVSISATDNNAADNPVNTGEFTITSSENASGDLTVFYSVSGTAVSGTDYISVGSSAVILNGTNSITVDLTPILEAAVEGTETVIIQIIGTSDASNYAIDGSNDTATVNIYDTPLDTDNDGVPDEQETIDGTDPNDVTSYTDTDGGGAPDYVEQNSISPTTNIATKADDGQDTDGDGAPDWVEIIAGTDPNSNASVPTDTDGDGVADIAENMQGTDPNDPTSYQDTDGDGHPDIVELVDASNGGSGDPDSNTTYPTDTDGDGVPDVVENQNGTDPNNSNSTPTDTDGDGHPDYVEVVSSNSGNGGDYNNSGSEPTDSDGDGVPDVVEDAQGTNDLDATSFQDTDGDGAPDYVEGLDGSDSSVSTDANDLSTNDGDNDGVPDYVEIIAGTDPASGASTPADTDNDGVPDVIETMQGTDPNDATSNLDTDGDGHPDYVEEIAGTDPNSSAATPADSDGDGVPDVVEDTQGTDSNDATSSTDTDGDGHPDYVEGIAGSDPTSSGSAPNDTDGDGVPDVIENTQGTDPNDSNSFQDGDSGGVSDYLEGIAGTDSTNSGDDATDTDSDGYPDWVEELAGSDPNSSGSTPTDTDGDGVPNVIETINGTDPNDTTSFQDTDGDGAPDFVETNLVSPAMNPNSAADAGQDTDSDGYPDWVEVIDDINGGGGDPNNSGSVPNDADEDYVPDVIEDMEGTDPNTSTDATDTDNDGHPDYIENIGGGDAASATTFPTDTDGDGVPDIVENEEGTDPNDATSFQDTDSDGIPDYIEQNYGPIDVTTDTDGDNVPDYVEIIDENSGGGGDPDVAGTDGTNAPVDTDNDGVPDVLENMQGTDPNDATSFLDTDGDGAPDYIEESVVSPAMDPNDASDADTSNDGDGYPDYVEAIDNLNGGPGDPDAAGSTENTDLPNDADNDGVPDVIENMQGTDPNDASSTLDSDNDGHPDYAEELDNSDPNSNLSTPTDTDSDGVPDVIENQEGTDPNNVSDFNDANTNGTPDYVEANSVDDIDGDGLVDSQDPNDDNVDTDGDGIPDGADVDVDGDSTPDNGTDTDGDGINDTSDVDQTAGTDTNGDGIDDSVIDPTDSDGDGLPDQMDPNDNNSDTDGDGIPDGMDVDVDNDGTPDNGTDTDGDGINDNSDVTQTGGTDTNGDGIDDAVLDPTDSDGDGLVDQLDPNDNNIDTDGDGIPDGMDVDVDNDGTPDNGTDTDGDGINDASDVTQTGGTDANGDGIDDAVLDPTDNDGDGLVDVLDPNDNNIDTDGDGIPDGMDVDVDNDGTPDNGTDTDGDGINDASDVTQTGGTDANGDGIDDAVLDPTDSDGDGLVDQLDPNDNNTDTDGDGIPDGMDVDVDNDGTPDNGTDTDGDGINDASDVDQTAGTDANGDGIDDAVLDPTDSDGDGLVDVLDPNDNNSDTDGDGIPDGMDVDVDNDGTPDNGTDTDGDGINDASDVTQTGGTDTNGDGIDDSILDPTDTDGDGLVDSLDPNDADPDTDNDGIPDGADVDVNGDTTLDNGTDTDGDGINDNADVDQTGGTDANGDGMDDAVVPPTDADGDGLIDLLDPNDNNSDTDGDGIPDGMDADVDGDTILDNGTDTDGDGINDDSDVDQTAGTDANGDGIDDAVLDPTDSDGDGLVDQLDPNDNNSDTDGDGIPDGMDVDVDNDGTPDNGTDTDGDGINDASDVDQTAGTDANGDGIDDAVLDPTDSDGDGLVDQLDPNDNNLDTDGDGIPDGMDVDVDNDGTPDNGTDTDGDGINDASDVDQTAGTDANGDGIDDAVLDPTDSDGDGLVDQLDPNDNNSDTDGDGIPDGMDVDVDNDGTPDNGTDTDGDGINDASDVDQTGGADTDGDGIDDSILDPTDSDGDGLVDQLDPDDVNTDTDGDGIPDGMDVDVDNDGTPDNGTDTDGDGINDASDVDQTGGTDTDGDNIDDAVLDPADTDGDGLVDQLDPNDGNIDTDGDGIPDSVDVDTDGDSTNDNGTDTDGDGINDAADVDQTGGADTNGDGIDDAVLDPTDSDGDGLVDQLDPNDNNLDTDGDGIPDGMDVDVDNDGTPDNGTDTDGDGINDASDVDQTGGTDTNGDGIDDAVLDPTDSDGDGLVDQLDPNDNNSDTDGDGIPDGADVDVDNDGTPDNGTDTDGDGINDASDVDQTGGTDADGDGIDDSVIDPTDSDGDALPDQMDPNDGNTDIDGDGIPDGADVDVDGDTTNDNGTDTDGDGINDAADVDQTGGSDVDGDGIDDAFLPPTDTDGDGVPDSVEATDGTNPADSSDYLDADGDRYADFVEDNGGSDSNDNTSFPTDTDGDGVPDIVEVIEGTDANDSTSNTDGDGDGDPNYVEIIDNNNGGTGDTSINTATPTDTDGDGVPDFIENAQGTDANDAGAYQDNDGGGVPDYLESKVNLDSSTNTDDYTDTDGDGVPDAIEVLPSVDTDPNSTDTDGDGIPDEYDVDQTAGTDADGDGRDDALIPDSDGDSVPDYDEAASFNNGDGNGDGIPDVAQQNIASRQSSGLGSSITLVTDTSSSNCDVINRLEIADSALPTDPAGYTYPYGMVDYELTCTSSGQTAEVTMLFGDETVTTSNWVVRKYVPATSTFTTLTALSPTTDPSLSIGTTTITSGAEAGKSIPSFTYFITDDDTLDDETTTADRIADPIGPGIAPTSSSGGGGGGGGGSSRIPISQPVGCVLPFPDVNSLNVFNSYITRLYCEDIVRGTSAGLFEPERTITRGEMASIVAKAFKFSDLYTQFPDIAQTYSISYGTVTTSEDIGLFIKSAPDINSSRNGVIKEGDRVRIFVTQDNWSYVKYNEITGWVYNPLLNIQTVEVSGDQLVEDFYSDSIEGVHKENILLLTRIGIVGGYTDGGFKQHDPISREQLAKILFNSLPAVGIQGAVPIEETPYRDVNRLNKFRGFIGYLSTLNVIDGYSDNTFRPHNFITRGEASKMVSNTMDVNQSESAE